MTKKQQKQNKKLVKKESKDLIKKYTSEETKKTLLERAVVDGDLSNNLRNFGEDLLPKFLEANEKEERKLKDEFNKMAREILFALETETHAALMETFWSQYRGLSKELSTQIIKDYNAVTSAEKALAEVIANAFIRIIDNSRRLNNYLGNPEEVTLINEDRTKYLAMLSKQIDRANRQFITAFTTLKQMKSPTLELNVKTKIAFVAQNQQINVDRKDDVENNEAK